LGSLLLGPLRGDRGRADVTGRLQWAAPLGDLAIAVALVAWWYLPENRPIDGISAVSPWTALSLVGLWLGHWTRTTREVRRSRLAAPLMFFLASAAVGVWTAYDTGVAGLKFWRMLSAAGLACAIGHLPGALRTRLVLPVSGALGVVLSLLYVVSGSLPDAEAMSAAVPIASLHAPIRQGINANVAGGALAVLFPFAASLFLAAGQCRWGRWLWAVLAVGFVAALALGGSRGGLGAVLAVGCVWAAWRALRSRAVGSGDVSDSTWRRQGRALVVATALLCIGMAAFSVVVSRADLLWSTALLDRWVLLTSALPLARDYLFTGAGLGSFPMQYSVYALLIHVGYVQHGHNMLMDVAIEQGILGLVSVIALGVSAVWEAIRRLRTASPEQALVIEATIASIAVASLHGVVDDALYESRAMAVLAIPLGLCIGVSSTPGDERPRVVDGAAQFGSNRVVVWVALALVVLIAVAAGQQAGPVRGMWYANLGAVEQARVELGAYDQWRADARSLDAVRREEDLDRAVRLLEKAVSEDPAQVTAQQRLAQIHLARGEYDEGLRAAEALWAAGNRDSVTRLLYGDALVAHGRTEQAVGVVRGVPWAVFRLLGQMWVRYYANSDWERALDAGQAVLLLEPGHEDALLGISLAEQRLSSP